MNNLDIISCINYRVFHIKFIKILKKIGMQNSLLKSLIHTSIDYQFIPVLEHNNEIYVDKVIKKRLYLWTSKVEFEIKKDLRNVKINKNIKQNI